MQIPEEVFTAAVWAAYVSVGAGSLYLLVVLVREWIRRELW
jgi:hypothetical protein